MDCSGKIVLWTFFFTLSLSSQERSIKCGLTNYVRSEHISKEHFEILSTDRPILQKNQLTPSGKFRIHFDTAGTNVPAVVDDNGLIVSNTSYRTFIDTLAAILDSVWRAEIDQCGFAAPVSDAGRGGGNEYDIYVVNLGNGLFGETVPEYDFPLTPGKTNEQFTSFIRVDNDFGIGYRTKGVSALKVTCAHEFQHAIQLSGTGLWNNDLYFYEMCAEAFEPLVFPEVKDYLFDVKTFFDGDRSTLQPSPIPLFTTTFPGYERAIFGLFLMKKHGTAIMREIWSEMKTYRPVFALQKVYDVKSTSLENDYAEFSDWIYFTGSRADSSRYFGDASIFPAIQFFSTDFASNSAKSIQGKSKSFSTYFTNIIHGSDSTHFVLTTTDLQDALTGNNQDYFFQIDFSLMPAAGLSEIRPNLFAAFSAVPKSDIHFWKYRVQTSQGPFFPVTGTCYPNPFDPSRSKLVFNVDLTAQDPVELFIYTSSMDLVYAGPAQTVDDFGKSFAGWDGKDNEGNLVSSGIYFYFLNGQSTTIRGKFAVIR